MRTSSAAFAAAIGTADTEPATAFGFTWPAGIAGVPVIPVSAVESLEVRGSWTTDMPEGAKLLTGYPARGATLVLSGQVGKDETQSALWLFDPWCTTSPLYGQDWTGPDGVQITYDQGLQLTGVAAPELFRQFTGYVDKITSIDRATGQITLELVDTRAQLRTVPNLPMVIANDTTLPPGSSNISPGLTGLWFIDQLLRANGINSTPPATSTTCWMMSGHGSIWPEVAGTVSMAAFTPNDPTISSTGWVPGQFAGQVPNCCQFAGTTSLGGGFVESVGLGVTMEFWIKTNGIVPVVPAGQVTPCTLTAGNVQITVLQTNTGQVSISGVGIWRGTATSGSWYNVPAGSLPVLSPAGVGWHQVDVLVTWASNTTARIQVFFEGSATAALDMTLTGLPSITAEDQTTILNQTQVAGYFNLPVEGLRLQSSIIPITSGWTAQADLDASLNELTAAPQVDGTMDSWQLIQAIAGAEFAVAGFNESARFFFQNRLNRPTAAQVVLSTLVNVKALQPGLSESMRARTISAVVRPLAPQIPAPVWTASSVIIVPARTTAMTIMASLNAPAWFVPTSTVWYPDGGPVPPYTSGGQLVNWYRAYKWNDYGHQAALHIAVTQIDANTVKIIIQNPNGFDVALADNQSGGPALYIVGQGVGPAGQSPAGDSNSDGSITVSSSYGSGAPALQLPDSAWRQDTASTQAITDALLSDLVRPRPMLDQLPIVGDPRLQLGDRAQLQDSGELVTNGATGQFATLADDVLVMGITTTYSALGGFQQAIVARTIAPPRQWILGQPGRSEIGSTTWI